MTELTGGDRPNNRILAQLPSEEYQRLVEASSEVPLKRGQILYDWGETIADVFFPEQGVISLVASDERGRTCEVALVGNDGFIGLPVFLGGYSTPHQALVQHEGSALKLSAEILQQEFRRGGYLQTNLLLFVQALFTQVAHTLICNNFYPIEVRLARWLLLVHDYAQTNELTLTQESIATMLCIRRASVSEAAKPLKEAGILRSGRGRITILNRQALEEKAGESYLAFKREYNRVLFSNVQT